MKLFVQPGFGALKFFFLCMLFYIVNSAKIIYYTAVIIYTKIIVVSVQYGQTSALLFSIVTTYRGCGESSPYLLQSYHQKLLFLVC